MNLKDLGAQIAAEHPQLNARVVDKVLRAAFSALRAELASTTESSVKCGPLGTFKLQDKAAKEGEPAAEAKQRRIVLRLSAAKAEGAAKSGKAAKAGKPAKAGKKSGKPPVDEAARAERKAARQAAKAPKKDTTPDAAS